jgi:phosphoribosylanthranilate isomerase
MDRNYILIFSFLLASCQSPDDFPVAQCPVLLQSASLPASEGAATAQKQAGKVFSNKDIRVRYLCDVAQIAAQDAEQKAQNVSLEARALKAFEIRHNARKTARAMMQNAAEVTMLKARDQEKYGNPDGPTFEWLVEKAKGKGLSGDAIYQEIIESAQRTNVDVNKALGL